MRKTLKSLWTSAIALTLCVSMLLGTTFAWFTDSVSSDRNIIAAGNLDVELEYLKGDSWKPVREDTNVFKDAKWEPGYTEVVYLRVSNLGSLALKYMLSVKIASEIASINVNGESFRLSEFIKIGAVDGVSTPYSDRGVAQTAVESSARGLRDGYTKTSRLEEGDVAYVALVLYMPESVGNEANRAKGEAVPKIDLGLNLVATQADSETDGFGNSDYDANAGFPALTLPGAINKPVEKDAQGKLLSDTVIEDSEGKVKAEIPAGIPLAEGVDTLSLLVKEMESSGANLTLADNEILRSLNVHIEGIADGNTTPTIITVKEALMPGLNLGNLKLVHVEDGVNKEMVRVNTLADLDAHNEFVYDPATGDITLAMASFSEVALVADTENKWEGAYDDTWYNTNDTEFTIANADQLAALSAIVGGMIITVNEIVKSYEADSFKDKTVKLIADVNLGDKESENNADIIFYPIGYYNSEGTYEKTNTAITSGLRNFEGVFDGNGHTIANFYQNTWEMKGDHDWYDATLQYYRDGMGLFGRVYGGTVKNLTVKNFSSDGEITTTGTIAAYAEGATFENIAIFNCNPRVYNIGNGGIVGCVGWYAKEAGLQTTFTNITVDNSNKISALWGSYDVACGGIVGQYYPTSGQSSANYPVNAGIHFENCHISAQMDVYNDVCANYQYYAYRYAGILLGSVRENETIDGYVYPKMDGITAKDCTVHFGDWHDYYYCEIIDNTTASYTHDYQMSRLTEIKAIDGTTVTYLDGTTGTVPASGRANYVIVDYTKGHGTDNATCYHFKDGAVWNHEDAGYHDGENGEKFIDENKDGNADLKEDKQHIYLEFNNLVTGYGWGVTSKGVNDLAGVTILDREIGDSVVKFEVIKSELTDNRVYKLGAIFAYLKNCGVKIVPGALVVGVTNLDENGNVIAEIEYDRENWENSTIKFTNTGNIKINIQDYYFCTPTELTVNITERQPEVKFDVVMNNGDFLHRVGNIGTVAFNKLFKAKDGVEIGNVSVTVAAVNGTNASGTYSNDAIQFNGTGVVKVTVTDNDYCIPTVLYLEVVDAVNATGATSATENNVVLLNDAGLSSLTVSGRYTFYGNGFTLTYTGNGQYLNNGLKQGIVTVSENGTLDNLRIKASIYPSSYLYYDEVKKGPSSVEGDKTRYHYQLSAVTAKDNATISNCYIYGGRNNIFINTGDVTVKDTVLECGTLANVQIQSNNSHTVTFENVTTIQYLVDSNVTGTTSAKILGAGVIVGPDAETNPTIILNGEFKQYNWVTAEDKVAITNSTAQTIIETALDATAFNHTVNGKTSSNLGIIYLNNVYASVTNNTGLPYEFGNVEMMNQSGKVYSLQNATESQIYSDYKNADRSTENSLYQPQFKYPADLGEQYIAKTDDGDEFCYREGDTIYVMFPSGDTKELDLAALVNITKYSGQDLGLAITCKDENGNAVAVTDGKITLSAAGEYTVTYTVTDTLFYDKDGKKVSGSETYSWNVTVSVSLKDTAVPDAYFEFDSTKQKMGYYKPSFGDVKQYLPFLAGLKIHDYNGQTSYLRFDGDADFNKIASITITGYTSNEAYVEVKLTDGGVINTKFLARADSGGGSTYTGKIKTSNNTVYFVSDGGTSNKDTTTTAAYWYVDYYKFIGNNGVAIQSAQQTFNSTGSSASTPSGNFSTTIKYTVTYDPNAGNCGQTTGYATSVSAAVTLPTPTRSGYIFAGWYTAASGGTRVGGAGEGYTPSEDITLYAQWGKPCTVTYNANGGSCGTASEKYTGTALTLPTPTRDGYWFIGWYDAAEGGNKIGDAGATYNPSGEITLYAHWQEEIEYTVTYNPNGGTCGTASATYQGTALTLPTPTRTGYKFLGWYTATSGGNKIGDAGEYTPDANITLYAQWEQISYTITIEKQESATVTVDKTTAHYGDTISVTVTFSESNSKTLTVKDASGNTVLSKSAAGTYDFTMPASNITIEASSSGSCFTPETLITLADGTQKRVDELCFGDKILAWDFFTGAYVEKEISLLVNHGEALYRIANLQFSDGTVLRTIAEHGVFDYDLNKFVYITVDNMQDYVGHRFVQYAADGSYNTATLSAAFETEEYTSAWSVSSAGTSNAFASGLLTVAPPEDFYNWIEMGGKLIYDVEQFQKDVETYGLYTYDDFKDYVTYEQFVAWNGAYLKVAVEKGYFTFDYILELIELYKGWMPNA